MLVSAELFRIPVDHTNAFPDWLSWPLWIYLNIVQARVGKLWMLTEEVPPARLRN